MSSNIDFESDEHTLTCCIGDILSPRENIVKHALNNSDKSHKKSLRKVAKNNASWNSPNVKSYISLQPVMAMQRVSSITRFPQIEQAVLPKSNPLSTRFSGNNSFGANGITHYSLLAQTGEPQRKRIQSPEECFMQVRSIPLLEIPAGQKERLQPYGNIGMRKESNMNAVEMKRKEITSVNTIKYCDP